MAGAFQADAFQNDAFQVDAAGDTVSLGLISNLGQIFAPAVLRPTTIELNLISNLGQVFAPERLFVPISVDLISNLGQAFAPVVIGPQPVGPMGVIQQATTVWAPVVMRPIPVDLISQLGQVFAPTVRLTATIAPALIDQAGMVFPPTLLVDGQVDPPPPPPPVDASDIAPSIVRVTVGSFDVTDDVIYRDMRLVSQVNGRPGSCYIRIRDTERTQSFTIGERIKVVINGKAVWSGHLMSVRRAYAFDVDDTTAPLDVTRFLILEGPDINILFQKRVAYRKAQPTDLVGKGYKTKPIADTTVLRELLDNYLDLSDDTINTTTLVENVGNTSVDQESTPIAPSETWESNMQTIARLPGSIFYINPDRQLVLTDVDTPNAPYPLSDTPVAGVDATYREMTIFTDGSNLQNDVLIFGAGGGSKSPKVKRLTSAGSVASYGRWQYGRTYTGAWKQGTVDQIASSIVNGSPQSKRGAKEVYPVVECTTYAPGFLPAQKVDFTSDAWNFSDVIPIRRMEITFPSPSTPKYRMWLSHERDLPIELIDPIFIPKLGFSLPNLDLPVIDWAGLDEGNCGIFDDFNNRSTSDDWGVASSGFTWINESGAELDVSGGLGTADTINANATAAIQSPGPWSSWRGFVYETRFQASVVPSGSDQVSTITLWAGTASNSQQIGAYLHLGTDTGPSANKGKIGVLGMGQEAPNASQGKYIEKADWVAGTWYRWKWEYRPGQYSRAKVWAEGFTEPGWMVSALFVGAPPPISKFTRWRNQCGRTIFDPSPNQHTIFTFDWMDFYDHSGHCCPPSLISTQTFANVAAKAFLSKGVSAALGDFYGIGTPPFYSVPFFVGGILNRAEVLTEDTRNEQLQIIAVRHAAPDGATRAVLRCRVYSDDVYNLESQLVSLPGRAEVGWQIRSWSGDDPVHTGFSDPLPPGGLAHNTYQRIRGGTVVASGSLTSYGSEIPDATGADTDPVEVDVPIIDGQVRFAIMVNDATQTLVNAGYFNNVDLDPVEAQVQPRWPSFPAVEHPYKRLSQMRVGTTLTDAPGFDAAHYELLFYGTCPGSTPNDLEEGETEGDWAGTGPFPGQTNCQNFTGNGSTTLFTVVKPYSFGSITVIVDGRLLSTSEYEETAPSLGRVTLTDPPANGVQVRICYQRAGHGGGRAVFHR